MPFFESFSKIFLRQIFTLRVTNIAEQYREKLLNCEENNRFLQFAKSYVTEFQNENVIFSSRKTILANRKVRILFLWATKKHLSTFQNENVIFLVTQNHFCKP